VTRAVSPRAGSAPAEFLLAADQLGELCDGWWEAELGFAAAGAALAELVRTRRISVSPEQVMSRSADRCADRVTDAVLERILLARRSRSPQAWIKRLGAEVLRGARSELVAGGVLMPVRRRALGMIPRWEYVCSRPDLAAAVAGRVRTAALAAPADARDAELAALLHAVRPHMPLPVGVDERTAWVASTVSVVTVTARASLACPG
jgi:hypothetical protein